jgi:hypothetical protein
MWWRQIKADGPVQGVALKWSVPEPESEQPTEAQAGAGEEDAAAHSA